MRKGTATDRDKREKLARTIVNDLASNSDRGSLLTVVDSDGRKPMVFALDHELLSEVMHRVAAAGGSANVFVQFDEGDIVLATVDRASDVEDAEYLGPEPIHRDITIGMFSSVAMNAENGVIATIRLPRHSADVSSVRSVSGV